MYNTGRFQFQIRRTAQWRSKGADSPNGNQEGKNGGINGKSGADKGNQASHNFWGR